MQIAYVIFILSSRCIAGLPAIHLDDEIKEEDVVRRGIEFVSLYEKLNTL